MCLFERERAQACVEGEEGRERGRMEGANREAQALSMEPSMVLDLTTPRP